MPLVVNLRHLEAHNVRLQGQLAVEELDIDTRDQVIQVGRPLDYDVEVEKLGHNLLAQGRLCVTLDCHCVRCLKPFQHRLELSQWTCLLPLEGEERVAVVNDCVDLTPYAREDILLEFPQHPLCEPACRGLPESAVGKAKQSDNAVQAGPESSAWAELNKLKL
jgi:uncharacterized protein